MTKENAKDTQLANNEIINAVAKGIVNRESTSQYVSFTAHYVKGMKVNLLSLRHMTQAVMKLVFEGGKCIVTDKKGARVMTTYVNEKELYIADILPNQPNLISKCSPH